MIVENTKGYTKDCATTDEEKLAVLADLGITYRILTDEEYAQQRHLPFGNYRHVFQNSTGSSRSSDNFAFTLKCIWDELFYEDPEGNDDDNEYDYT